MARPHRHKRTSISYAEEDDESYDDFFLPNTRAASKKRSSKASNMQDSQVDKRRRSLSLNKASVAQERSNPKERAEVMQLERAIKESISVYQRKQPSAEKSNHKFNSPHSEADSIAFKCLLDVVSESCDIRNGENKAESHLVHLTETRSLKSDFESNCCPDVINLNDDEDAEQMQLNIFRPIVKDAVCTKETSEDYEEADSPDQNLTWASKKLASRRSRKSLPVNRQHNLDHCTVRGGSEALIDDQQKNNCHQSKILQDLDINRISENETTFEQDLELENEISKDCESSRSVLRDEKSGLLDSNQPLIPRRRVVGLSRRFKPPPLHPYLPTL